MDLPAVDLVLDEGKAHPREIAPAAGAADDHVGVLADLLELPLGLEADDRLVHENVIEHAPEGVAGVLARDGVLDGLADGDAEAAGAIGVLGEDVAPRLGAVAGAGDALRTPGLHHHPPVGLLVIADPHHVDAALQVEHPAGHGQRAAPLASARLRREPLDAVGLVVVGLGHGRVGLVGAGGADAFVLVVDLDGAPEGLLEIEGAPQGRRPPEQVLVQDLLGDLDPALRAHLLLDEVHGEDDLHVLGPDRLACAGVQRGIHRPGQIRQDVVPLPGDLRVVEHDLPFFHFSVLLPCAMSFDRSFPVKTLSLSFLCP